MKKLTGKKLKRYKEALAKVNTYRDGLGLRVDKGIKKTVALLNLLGHTTSASCEGHVEVHHGTLSPWVDIDFGKKNRKQKELKLRKLIRSFWQYRYRTGADMKITDARSLHMEDLGTGKDKQIRIVLHLEWDLFAKFKDKKKMPLPVRKWFSGEGKRAMREFTQYLMKVYTGEERILRNPKQGIKGK